MKCGIDVVTPGWSAWLDESPVITCRLLADHNMQSVTALPIFEGTRRDDEDCERDFSLDDGDAVNAHHNICGEENRAVSEQQIAQRSHVISKSSCHASAKQSLPSDENVVPPAPLHKRASPRFVTRPRSDPVSLFHKHQVDWERQKKKASECRRRPLRAVEPA